jgi:hypothetical protein
MHAIAPQKWYRQTDPVDFPDTMQYVLNTGLPRLLIGKAGTVGDHFKTLIIQVLRPHFFLNLRRAQGLFLLAEKYEPELIDEAAQLAISYDGSMTPKYFQKIIE